MARRLHQTLADYVVIAISPALIMALVGSLVFFLLKVFYQGQFESRLNWVMACFVFAAVLIGRISIEEGMERAAMFAVALAVPVGIAANRFMEFHGGWIEPFAWLINWGMIGLIWWCTHRLVWDCTLIDDAEDASGEGLLQTAGLERPAESEKNPGVPPPIEGTTSRELPSGWWQRYIDRQRRPHAPGVWVVYFSLAALPLFGIGQWFIPESDTAGRRYAFWLLSIYVAAGMGLLLTTSFLGLRRYLRQRRIEMPTLMANVWLGMGAVVIAVLLVFAALLPRPSAEYAISQLPISLGSPQVSSSRMAPIDQEGTPDEQPGPAPADQSSDEPPTTMNATKPATDQQSAPSESPPAPKDQGTPQPQADDATPPSESPPNDPGGNKGSDKGSKGSQGVGESKPGGQAEKSSQPDQPASEPSEPSPSQPPPGSDFESKLKQAMREHARQQSEAKTPQSQPAERPPAEQKPSKPTQHDEPESPPERPGKAEPQPEQPQESQPPETQPAEQPSAALAPSVAVPIVEAATSVLAMLLKGLFYVAVILSAAYALWRWRADVLAAIREFLAGLRDFWDRLWGRKRPSQSAAGEELVRIEFPPAPFSSFADPFVTGIATRYSTEELVRYSFEAFEAWAREHGCPRKIDTTPHELARDVSKRNAPITADARNLAELYARVAYAEGDLPPHSSEQLKHLWQTMRSNTVGAP